MTSLVEIKNNFKNFSLDTYGNLVNIKNISNFLSEYDKIQKQDFIKPVFTLTKKYSNYSNKKNDNEWKKYKATTDNEKLEEIIKSNMNKISKKTFEIISKKLIADIKKFENSSILEIISNEIYNKTIFDIKFQSIYLNVISNIWNDNSFYNNLVTVKSDSGKFYWVPKNGMFENKFRGPFENIKALDDNVYEELSLKNVFINNLQEQFKLKDNYMKMIQEDTLEDEEKYKISRKIFGFYEIIVKLYYLNIIPFFIVNYILNELVLKSGEKFYMECIHILLRLLVKDDKFNMQTFNNISKKSYFEYYLNTINNLDKSLFTKREKFMLLDINDFFNKILGKFSSIYINPHNKFIQKQKNTTNYKEKKEKKEKINPEVDIKENLLKNNYKKITYILKNNLESINDNLLTLFDYLFEYQNKKDIVINVLTYLLQKKILKKDILNSIYVTIENNLDDLELDIVNIREFYNSLKKTISEIK